MSYEGKLCRFSLTLKVCFTKLSNLLNLTFYFTNVVHFSKTLKFFRFDLIMKILTQNPTFVKYLKFFFNLSTIDSRLWIEIT